MPQRVNKVLKGKMGSDTTSE